MSEVMFEHRTGPNSVISIIKSDSGTWARDGADRPEFFAERSEPKEIHGWTIGVGEYVVIVSELTAEKRSRSMIRFGLLVATLLTGMIIGFLA
jgi:hypothetical protein